MPKQEGAEARVANNVEAIKDLFEQEGERLKKWVEEVTCEQLVGEKYLDHADAALHAGNKPLAWKLFRQSMKYNAFQHQWKYCTKVFLKLLVK